MIFFVCLVCYVLVFILDGFEFVEILIIDIRSLYKIDNGWVMFLLRDVEDWK